MFSTTIYVVIYLLAASRTSSQPYDNNFGPEYGRQWLLFVDDNGTTHEMHFSSLPMERRGLVLGKVYCYLFTRQNTDEGELLTSPNNSSKIESKYFNGSNEVKAITHGWLSSGSTSWLQKLKDVLLEYSDQNVIVVDWGEIAKNPLYPWPAFSTRYVGKHLANILKSLMQTFETSCKMHLIGHSLGAQVMGYAGMFLNGQVTRITGLDPARPLFEIPLMSKEYRLDKSDAKFVDIIHTCAGLYGYKNSHGHSDFYPNSGKAPQPGCEGLQQKIEACSHGRSYEYFTESIYTKKGFYSFPCDNWSDFRKDLCRNGSTLMGYLCRTDSEGQFYLKTNNQSDYACGE